MAEGDHFAHCSVLTSTQYGENSLCISENSGGLRGRVPQGHRVKLWENRPQNSWKRVLEEPKVPPVILLILTFAVCFSKTRTRHTCSGLEVKQISHSA